MNERMHMAKAEQIERSLDLLGVEAYEAVIEGAMLAGTHWFNMLLHRTGLAAENVDAMHAEFLTAGLRRKVALQLPAALAALDEIEALRTTHVRGDMPDGPGAARRALACLARLREQATKRSTA